MRLVYLSKNSILLKDKKFSKATSRLGRNLWRRIIIENLLPFRMSQLKIQETSMNFLKETFSKENQGIKSTKINLWLIISGKMKDKTISWKICKECRRMEGLILQVKDSQKRSSFNKSMLTNTNTHLEDSKDETTTIKMFQKLTMLI